MVVYVVGLLLLSVAAVLDASVLSFFRIANGQPSLVLLLVVAWGLLNDLADGLPWALIGGILADLVSVTPTGTSSLAFTLSLALFASVFGQVGRRNLLIPPLAVGIATALWHAVILLVLTVMGMGVPVDQAFITWTLPSLIFNAVAMLVVFRVMGGILALLAPPQVRL
ncbi:MAG: rod shape-determining protein MreD [Anaerolineae bacterium]|nr:rod shape-determining protein MreD [Anaerolineae bacterium]